MRWKSILALLLVAGGAAAETERVPRVHALEHARVVVRPGEVLEDATIVLRDGVIEAVGRRITPPADARLWDCTGRTVYAGLIEPWWDRTKPVPQRQPRRPGAPEPATPPPARGAGHENPLVHPELDVAATLALEAEELEEMRALGFVVAHVVPAEGVFRGQSAVVALRDGTAPEQLVRGQAAQVMAFTRARPVGRQPAGYPNSVMGSVALVRQTLLDAGWARDCREIAARRRGALPLPPGNESLVALSPVVSSSNRQPVWLQTTDLLDLLRAATVVREFGLDAVVLGSGDEYRRLDAVRATTLRLVVPVAFPDAPRFEGEDEAQAIEFVDLQHWDQAPGNPARLQEVGVVFAITSQGLAKRTALRSEVQKAIARGWTADAALAALTTVPASLLGLANRYGTIEPGKQASITVTDGDLFEDKTRILEVWVDGDRYEVRPKGDPLDKLRGDWKVVLGESDPGPQLHVEGNSEWTLQVMLEDAAGRRAADRAVLDRDVLVVESGEETLRLGPAGGRLEGTSTRETGGTVPVHATRGRGPGAERRAGGQGAADTTAAAVKPDSGAAHAAAPVGDARFAWPPLPPPAPPAVLVRGATIWTSGPQGKLEDADLLAVDGKIRAVGRGLRAPADALVVDGRGKHLTPGVIDCHSHSNIVGGVNESSNNCTAEVRIADVLNSESIAIYRELAGGVTAANQLHGSANAIGGQNAVMKLRWGAPPEGLLLLGAPPGIKFALGENPKQSNWGEDANGRYPQTRQGVEQSIRERFMAARDYSRTWAEWKRRGSKSEYPPRRDLQLETLAEILRGERLVHSHSYRADEILMLMRVAEEFGFRVATFQHVLEGYKVADELAAHGAGASAFSDWWAFKFEVYDAIPYAGALLWERGVVTSFNSDSSELARHLNLEAAKAVKYGGVPEEEALKFVTLNPAKQLRIDAQVGSLEPGKDADFAIWSASPLDATTRCEQTWIEGRRYFDRDTDLEARTRLQSERARLLEAARAARRSSKGEDGESGSGWRPSYWMEEDDASCHEEVEP